MIEIYLFKLEENKEINRKDFFKFKINIYHLKNFYFLCLFVKYNGEIKRKAIN